MLKKILVLLLLTTSTVSSQEWIQNNNKTSILFQIKNFGITVDGGFKTIDVNTNLDTKDLSMALKGATEVVQAKFLTNMSSRAAEGVREEMSFMGPVRLKDVEEVQQKIVDIIRRLEEDGEIIISGRGGDDDIVV